MSNIVAIVGRPNVGKSTLINRLVGRNATNVANKPGVTKQLDWIRINENFELLDSPGILWPKLDEEKVAFNMQLRLCFFNRFIDDSGLFRQQFIAF